MQNRLLIYRQLVGYLSDLFAKHGYALYERKGIRYPVIVLPPDPEQMDDVNSVLVNQIPRHKENPHLFAFSDEQHLADLKKSGRRVENNATFVFTQIAQHPLKIQANLGAYFDMLMTCDALEHELRDFFVNLIEEDHATITSQLKRRAQLHRIISPDRAIFDGNGRSAAIGTSTLIVFNHAGRYETIIARRSQNTGVEASFYHVLPSFMFQPTGPEHFYEDEWDVTHQIYREFLEELFGLPECDEINAPTAYDYFYDHPALHYLEELMADGRASLHLTGIAMNLLTMRPDICTLLMIYDPAWYERVSRQKWDSTIDVELLTTAWETDRRKIVFAPIEDDVTLLTTLPNMVGADLQAHMTPQGSAALWLGIDMARDILRSKK